MKIYDKIKTLPLVDVFNAYLEHNDLTIGYAARSMKVPYTNLFEWSKGMRPISQRNAEKVKEFLQGNFLVDVDSIINYLILLQEKEEENAGGTD